MYFNLLFRYIKVIINSSDLAKRRDGMELKRKIYNKLLNWKKKSNGKTALLIDGARRVGKSYIAESFAGNEYKSHILIDFANIPDEILNLFEHESYDLDLFFAKLSAF